MHHRWIASTLVGSVAHLEAGKLTILNPNLRAAGSSGKHRQGERVSIKVMPEYTSGQVLNGSGSS